MRICLIDVDGHNFPNVALMKLSAWHKACGDSVEWYEPLFHGAGEPLDIVYMAKVFSFTQDYDMTINAREVIQGGTGYCIQLVDGRERFDRKAHAVLPVHIERMYPDYSIYEEMLPEVKDTAYGYLTRGCPRGCSFCHVAAKEGAKSYKVADLSQFWRGQKNIVLLDPNITACNEWESLFDQLALSGARVDFSQGLDIRLMTDEKIEALKRVRVKSVHFAWDKYEDKEKIVPLFQKFAEMTGWGRAKMMVYCLCNFNTSIEQDLERIYTLRGLGYSPYVMLYDKEHIPRKHPLRRMQRWCNNNIVFRSCPNFEDYMP